MGMSESSQKTTCWCMLPVCDGTHTHPSGISNLTEAAKTGNIEAINSFLDLGKNANGGDVNVRTPLVWALQEGHVDAMTLLLERKANVNLRNTLEGASPLHHAVHCVPNIFRILLTFDAQLDVQNHIGKTPLHSAAQFGRLEIVQMLLNSGALCNVQDINSLSPLHIAAQNYQPEVMELLIRNKANIDLQDSMGNTALHYVCQMMSMKKYEMVEILLRYEASSTIMNKNGELPAHLAVVSTETQARLRKPNIFILTSCQNSVLLLDEKRTHEVSLSLLQLTNLPQDVTALLGEFVAIFEH